MRSDARTAARLAGALFLAAILIALAGGTVLSNIAGEGTFQEIAARIAASQRLYRAALSSLVIVSLSSALLAFALYATLQSVDALLAQLAMIFSLGDSFLALVVRMCGFVSLHLYLAAQTAGADPAALQSQSGLMGNIANITENIGGICFGIGLLLFFYLFFKSSYIPRVTRGPRLGLLGHLDVPVFCQPRLSGAPSRISTYLSPAHGPDGCLDRLLPYAVPRRPKSARSASRRLCDDCMNFGRSRLHCDNKQRVRTAY